MTAADGGVGRAFQAMPAQAVNKLGAQKCDGKALPPGVHRPSRTFMSHYSRTAVYALINQRSFVEMGWTLMNLSVGVFPLRAQIMEQNRPIWPLCKGEHIAGAVFSSMTKVTAGSRSEGWQPGL